MDWTMSNLQHAHPKRGGGPSSPRANRSRGNPRQIGRFFGGPVGCWPMKQRLSRCFWCSLDVRCSAEEPPAYPSPNNWELCNPYPNQPTCLVSNLQTPCRSIPGPDAFCWVRIPKDRYVPAGRANATAEHRRRPPPSEQLQFAALCGTAALLFAIHMTHQPRHSPPTDHLRGRNGVPRDPLPRPRHRLR